MKTKEQVFQDIQKIIQEDYAGYMDVTHLNHPEKYRITNDMSEQEFEETIKDYLLDFQDRHLIFILKKSSSPSVGFLVRRFENALYVTQLEGETRLQIGDKIVQLDGMDIPEIENRYKKTLMDQMAERQLWNRVVYKMKTIRIERGMELIDLPLSHYEDLPYKGEHTFKKIGDSISYMKLTDFIDEAPIQKLIDDNKNDLEQNESLIIDVRKNLGGSDTSYFPLFPYLFSETIPFADLFQEDEVMYLNYTERNCRLRIAEFEEYLKEEVHDITSISLKEEVGRLKRHFGQGMLEVPEDMGFVIKGKSSPKHVFVLSDCYCGSSGDTFVSNVKKSSKVTVVGRPSMGIMDYANVATMAYGDYEFIYSTTRMHENYWMNGVVIKPDVYIPWTPEHLKEDKDLEMVLSLIQQAESKAQ
ncbi:hypothetical protein KQ939_17550 [Planococcus sp. CP5-4]|uniref:S41 family peptidase n=1 Tax=unclassified Planococcus (in: firmicutes) TaxID=2662419 RepID=UPI001C2120EC|nr:MULTISPECIES: S41 family peptidase [unclassified Planococcus (in: firmicutes)]MBU9675149.1 hypothetical protein [Planococcus sp. CP5-4_YE]MBV0910682.1 hypothetical protein [Planococcus sp. CP5-4_UN]MBW6065464.1 hypothetical protein [Planococcus sp. CP5-4]